jgi:hypothetical protein
MPSSAVLARFWQWAKSGSRRLKWAGVVTALMLLAALGWKPRERHLKASAPTFTVVSNQQSGGVTAGQYFERPPRRDLSYERLQKGLLSLLDRQGAKVEVSALVEPEAMRFEYEIQRFLLERGFDVLGSANTQVGGRPAFGQDFYELDWVYVIELGADDGSRDWKHVTSMTSTMFRPRKDLSTAGSIQSDWLDEHR